MIVLLAGASGSGAPPTIDASRSPGAATW